MASTVVPPAKAATSDAVEIRRAAPRDFEIVIGLRRSLRREERPGEEPIDAQLRSMTRKQLNAAGQVIFLAEVADEAVGILRCALQAPTELVARTALLTTAYVDPAWRRRGIMTRLVDAAEGWCASHGVRDLRLRNAHDNAAANGAWEALGFRVVQVVRQRRTER
ncbi:MAG: GNAT family N-acetyltransferase [Cytophagaceae bacterium]|nr:GNAT family N-acetyltransferase [Gemmatimonadaceae bacterium]